MAVIQPKRKVVIKKGVGNYTYDPKTFKQHKMKNSFDTDKAEDVYKLIQPFEFRQRKFLVMDTEDFPLQIKSNELPRHIVRRWIGSGKNANPVDLPFCMSFCDGKNMITLYDSPDNDYREFKKMVDWLEDETIEKVFHNTKFDMHMLANIGLRMKGKLHDTVVLCKLTNENRPSFTLKDIAAKKPWGIVKFEYMVDNYKKSHKIVDYRFIPRELLTEYANADVWNCYNVFVEEYPILEQEELEALYENELQLMVVSFAKERFGMKVDANYEEPLKAELQQLVDEAERAIYEEAGTIFNVNSGKQLYPILLKKGVDRSLIQISEKGNPVLDKDALQELAEKHNVELAKRILEFRKYEKLLGTYAVGIYDQRDSAWRVHGNINQTEATTGRMSITKPALQTLPKKDKRIRKIFIPEEGFELWFMDLDQIEYRLFAHYAKAQGLIEAIKKGWDVHQATAAIIYGVPYEEVTEEQRTKAKTVNFSLIYGQGDKATADSLKMSLDEARSFKAKYFAMIPEALPFIRTVQTVTKLRGYIRNFYNRRRRLKLDEVYKAPNALIQGCAADYMKHKLVLIYKFLMAHGYKTRMINVVHDEVVFEVHKSELFLIPKLRWLLSDFENFRVPITAGVDRGNPSWGEKEEVNIDFEPLTEEEMKATLAYNVFNGDVFEITKTA